MNNRRVFFAFAFTAFSLACKSNRVNRRAGEPDVISVRAEDPAMTSAIAALAVPRDSIADWMLVQGDTVFGAFTVYALRDHMSPAERAEFDRGEGAHFGPTPRALQPDNP